MTHHANRPTKLCVICGRPFQGRKKWKTVWDDVKYCSERCRGHRSRNSTKLRGKKKPMYTFPDLSNREVLYKGRRFVVFAVSAERPFDGCGQDGGCDFVVWDGKDAGVISCGKVTRQGVFRGSLAFSHVDIDVDDASSPREFVSNSHKKAEWYFKGIGL